MGAFLYARLGEGVKRQLILNCRSYPKEAIPIDRCQNMQIKIAIQHQHLLGLLDNTLIFTTTIVVRNL